MPKPKSGSNEPAAQMPKGVEPPLKPATLDTAPAVAPKTIEAEKSPF